MLVGVGAIGCAGAEPAAAGGGAGTVAAPAARASAAATPTAASPAAATPPAATATSPAAPDATPWHPVFSLADNRLLAHVLRDGGLVVLPGRGGVAKYLHFGFPSLDWKLGERRDGRRVGVVAGKARLDVPLDADGARAAASITLRLTPGERAGTLEVVVNDRRAGRADLAPGWQTVTVAVPPGHLVAGENRLELRGRAAIEWLQVGGAAPAPDDPPPLFDAADGALLLPRGGGLAYYVHVPAGARLAGAVEGDGCTVTVAAAAADGAAATGTLDSAGAGDGGGARTAIDLAPLAGRAARLELTASGPCPLARLKGAGLELAGPAPVARQAPPPRNVVLWIMDTLRYDRTRLFHPDGRAEVPAWERIAASGAVFRTAYVQGNSSEMSHASIFTGLYPVNHGVIAGVNGRFPKDAPTIGRELAAAGLYATGVSANGYIVRDPGYGWGFDAFRNLMRDPDYGGRSRSRAVPAADLYDVALATLAGRHDRPFFLFLGTIDTHVPWIAREPWVSRYDPEPYHGRYLRQVDGGNLEIPKGGVHSRLALGPRDLARVFALYDCGVSYQDQQVGRLLDQLEAWGVLDETLIVITADHGEEIFEEGFLGHGASVREVLVHVPLLVRYPPLFPAGTVVEEGVDTLDVLPTVLEALGRPLPPALQGESLAPLAQGVGRGYPRPAITTQHEFVHAMRLGTWKLRVARKTGRVELYDLVADPSERQPVTDRRPLERRHLTDAYSTFMVNRRAWRKSRWGVASNMTAQGAAELDPP